jgi:hypothetical protein
MFTETGLAFASTTFFPHSHKAEGMKCLFLTVAVYVCIAYTG